MNGELANDILLERFDAIACNNCGQSIDTSRHEPFDIIPCPSCGNELRIPARFANFILLDQLGKGGMGAVYKAYDETLGRTVAIKVMQQSIGQDREFVAQFLQEARALAAINHPNIVQIYNYGEENGQPYIVMELVDGGRLDHMQEKHCQLNETFVLQTALQVIAGLQAAHAAGMTHGDIKPANILFDTAGHAKVADFGLARFKGEKPKPGEIWGTPYYVAPEVVRGQSPDAGSDIYSLGGTLYHVLTGEPPFNGETVTDTVLLRFKEPAPDPREFKASVSPKTAAILLRMLQMNPLLRYPTFKSLSNDIADALATLQEARSGKKKEAEKKSILLPVLISLIVLAAIGGIGWLTFNYIQKERKERAAQEQLERDLAEGRVVRRMINGRLVYARVDGDSSKAVPSSAAGAAAPAARVTEWTRPAIADISISPGQEDKLQEKTILLLRAGSQTDVKDASKIYLRFSLKGVDKANLEQATLQLTAGRKGTKRANAGNYQMNIWALRSPVDWNESITWERAPANDTASASELDRHQAVLLTTFDLPANPETGDRFRINAKPLTDFIRQYNYDDLTLILTGDTESDHKGGWRITALEDSDRFPPPTFLFKAK